MAIQLHTVYKTHNGYKVVLNEEQDGLYMGFIEFPSHDEAIKLQWPTMTFSKSSQQTSNRNNEKESQHYPPGFLYKYLYACNSEGKIRNTYKVPDDFNLVI